MIEAAAAEAASLRKPALADAARIAARVRGGVDVPPAPRSEEDSPLDELPLRGWKRPAVVPLSEPAAGSGSGSAEPGAADQPKRRGRRLAS